jgi:hypothetical protein
MLKKCLAGIGALVILVVVICAAAQVRPDQLDRGGEWAGGPADLFSNKTGTNWMPHPWRFHGWAAMHHGIRRSCGCEAPLSETI